MLRAFNHAGEASLLLWAAFRFVSGNNPVAEFAAMVRMALIGS
jgi:hypothetical protein